MNNLTDLREQLQEDLIAYFSSFNHSNWYGRKVKVDEVCQIIVDRVTELQDKWDTLNEDDAMKKAASFVSELINKTIEG